MAEAAVIDDVVDVVAAWASAAAIPVELALAVCWFESGLNLDAVGDNGRAFGLLQVHPAVHGGTGADWTGLEGARRSLRQMQSRWQQALRETGAAVWDNLSPAEKLTMFARFWPAAQGGEPQPAALYRPSLEAAARLAAGLMRAALPMPVIELTPAHPDNFARGRIGPNGRPVAPEAWVLHIAQGGFDGIASWFRTGPADRNPPFPSSAHFSVAKDGRIRQHVAPEDTAFANGIIQAGHTARLIGENGGINPNLWTVSCEHEGMSGEAPTAAMFEASARLCAWVFQNRLLNGGATGVVIDRDHIIRHGEISPIDRSGCPGWPEPVIADYIARVAEIVRAAGRGPRATGDGALEAYLAAHPEAGMARHTPFTDQFGNRLVWLAPTGRYPRGALAAWRRWLDRVQIVSWETADARLAPGSISDYLAANPATPRHAEQTDPLGNTFVWLAPDTTHRLGALLVWRRWLNATQLVGWEG